MLYAHCEASGLSPRRLDSLEELAELSPSPNGGRRTILHVHWTDSVLLNAPNQAEAERRLRDFVAALDTFLGTGGRLIWTVHNVLPHEARFPELEAKVCQALADRAAVVHVMCEETVVVAAPWYEIPRERVSVIAHASCLGVYPNFLARDEARARLGLEPEDTVLTAFGGLRPYKGIAALLDAFEAAASVDPGLRLVIAGRPIRLDGLEALKARCERNPRIVHRLRGVPDARVQVFLNAADAVILPHRNALNSGLVGLAFAFGRPVIAPKVGCIPTQVPPDCGVLFDPDDPRSLERAIADAAGLRDPKFEAAALERARTNPPAAMAAEFAELAVRVAGGG
jgi:glycosyltransferase involved in cell wall biosynthesis